MSLASNVRTRTVTDPLALRALAHPLRLELYSLVAREGSLTAADAARQLSISHALASHHLRQLAKYGFVEPAETSDHRAHPWRVTATSLDLKPTEPGSRASVDALDRYSVEQATHQFVEWQERRADEDPSWADLAGVHPSLIYLTPDELSAVLEAWTKIITPLVETRPVGHAAHRPAETVPVNVTLIAVPVARTEQGG
ncbi:MAG: helix-turn-helix domain-containing protein [Propionibacteriaceae bacterium]